MVVEIPLQMYSVATISSRKGNKNKINRHETTPFQGKARISSSKEEGL